MGAGRVRRCAGVGTGELVCAVRLAAVPHRVGTGGDVRQPTAWRLRLPGRDGSRTETTVSLGPPTATESQPPTAYGHREVINGISVYPYAAAPQGSYLVPSLRVEVTVDGLLAQQVLHTLTRSPRAVALARGPAPSVPSSWRSVTFARLRFSVPANWPVDRTSLAVGLGVICGMPRVALGRTSAQEVTLDTTRAPWGFCMGFPPFTIPTAPQQPDNGVQVDSGLRSGSLVPMSFSNPLP